MGAGPRGAPRPRSRPEPAPAERGLWLSSPPRGALGRRHPGTRYMDKPVHPVMPLLRPRCPAEAGGKRSSSHRGDLSRTRVRSSHSPASYPPLASLRTHDEIKRLGRLRTLGSLAPAPVPHPPRPRPLPGHTPPSFPCARNNRPHLPAPGPSRKVASQTESLTPQL